MVTSATHIHISHTPNNKTVTYFDSYTRNANDQLARPITVPVITNEDIVRTVIIVDTTAKFHPVITTNVAVHWSGWVVMPPADLAHLNVHVYASL